MKELIVNNNPKSATAEAIKTIKTNLRFSSVNKKIKTILITSSIANEGKSFISANLAATFTTSNEKVLLIDCDLRKGRQKIIFNMSEDDLGLSNLLIDNNWEKNIKKYIRQTSINNLNIITAGVIPPNPTNLLESIKLEQIISKLKEEYDIIILDTPPVIGLTDTLVLTRIADAVLIVAKAKKTPIDLLENTKDALKNVNANIAGIILNKIDTQNKAYYNYYK